MRKTNPTLGVILALLFASSAFAETALREGQGIPSWVVIKPVQCLDNAWEKEWLETHKAEATAYPVADEKKIVTDYFVRSGIKVSEVRSKPYDGSPRCSSCDCPRGDTLYVGIDSMDAPAVKVLGFDRIIPKIDPSKKK